MRATFRTLTLCGGILLLASASVVVVNQTAQLVQLASGVHPTLGTATLWGLVGLYTTVIGVPVVMIARLPRPLIPPSHRNGPEFEKHIAALRQRLRSNASLRDQQIDLEGIEGVEEGIRVLDRQAEQIVRETASRVFLATAVSQSGRLDTLLVLSLQMRMVWKIARLYYQRPTPRDMVHLYANVAGTSFVAGELQDADLAEQIEPVFSAVLGSFGSAVPGFQIASSILANSILSGAADAFLTLRVGMIASRYCGATVIEQPDTLRRAATARAAELLGGIVAEGSGKITRALWAHSRDTVSDAAKVAGKKLADLLVGRFRVRSQAEAV
jgi:hypothetical protein